MKPVKNDTSMYTCILQIPCAVPFYFPLCTIHPMYSNYFVKNTLFPEMLHSPVILFSFLLQPNTTAAMTFMFECGRAKEKWEKNMMIAREIKLLNWEFRLLFLSACSK